MWTVGTGIVVDCQEEFVFPEYMSDRAEENMANSVGCRDGGESGKRDYTLAVHDDKPNIRFSSFREIGFAVHKFFVE